MRVCVCVYAHGQKDVVTKVRLWVYVEVKDIPQICVCVCVYGKIILSNFINQTVLPTLHKALPSMPYT